MATLAMLHLRERILQRGGQLGGAGAIVLQQVVGHALSRSLAHAGQPAQGVHQRMESVFGHP
jgi:hypothetical protein